MSPAREIVHLNGRLLPLAEAGVSVLDRGFLYGDGLFETVRAYRGHCFRLGDHLERLADSAQALKIPLPAPAADLAKAIPELIRANDLSDAYVRLTLSRGEHPGKLILETSLPPTLLIVARPLSARAPEDDRTGIVAMISQIRQNAESPSRRHKTLNYLDNLLAHEEAHLAGAREAILLNTRGEVAEAATANLFLVEDDKLVTPSLETNILAGVTRKVVLEVAGELGLATEESFFGPDRLLAASEVFLTNSMIELLPVRQIGETKIGRGEAGPVTGKLLEAYRRKVERDVA